MKKKIYINKTLLFIIPVTIIFILINYFTLNKKATLLLSVFIYLTTLLTYLLIIHKKKTYLFLSNIQLEIKNITWPKKQDINQTTLMVVIIVLLASIILWITDSLLTYTISKIM